jgi:phosphoribosylanthranilate isomerase
MRDLDVAVAPRVKICGIRNLAEALEAVSAGADALGFLVGLAYASDDAVDATTARQIIDKVPPYVSTVLVTHEADPARIVRMCQTAGCTTVQLHGELPPRRIPDLRAALPGVRITAVVHVVDETALTAAAATAEFADAVHLDTRTAERLGGTGITHDWTISARIVRKVAKPVILAGGLTPDNVREAIDTVRPFAVDVNSGVEDHDGAKSSVLLRAFVRRAKGIA